jgi:hypothetical protein
MSTDATDLKARLFRGFVDPTRLAVLGDMGASVLVTLNGMRLLAACPAPRVEDTRRPTLA